MLALAAASALAFVGPAPSDASGHRHPAHRRPARVTVTAALQALLKAGAIGEGAYQQYEGAYAAAKRSLGRVRGTRREELGAVLENLEAMAAAGQLIASRLPVAFTTLERNRWWWTTQRLPGAGERVSVPGSHLVWEHYPGQGIEIQWLGTFGEANGYYLSHDTTALEEVLGEAIALATGRAGGIAWEYMFRFDGGSPPWTSALSQGTAIQALARAWERTHETGFLTAAQQALGIFRTPPAEGVFVQTPLGANYLQYSYAPAERIINGFVQSLVGLYEYAKLTGDPAGQQLFEAGDAEARAEVPRYDTGYWSMYDQHSESDLSYHELLAEFLEHLCERTSKGEPLAATGTAIPGDEIYCTTAKRFREDVKTPPTVALLTTALHTKQRGGVQIALSKIATVTMTIALGAKTVWRNEVTVEGGRPRLLWVTPPKPGAYTVTLRARDLAGNEAGASGTIMLSKAPKGRRGHTSSAAPISPPARPQPLL